MSSSFDRGTSAPSTGDLGPACTRSAETGTAREIRVAPGRVLKATPVFDSYWRFAAERQAVFVRRLQGRPAPWTTDTVIAEHRFTNVYRASDRVSQYLIRHVIYEASDDPVEVVFRTLLFKLFNKIETWELLRRRLGAPSWKTFDVDKCARVLDAAMASGDRVYSAAYIMPSPALGAARKHRNHLRLLDRMIRGGLVSRLLAAPSLEGVFSELRAQPSFGDFLAFQFAIDLNYSGALNFSEMSFVVAGPGARSGIKKCFSDTGGLTEADVIRVVAERADEEFERLGLTFDRLGPRPLQLIDCQNVFCEVDKYARVMHPAVEGTTGRTRIKQKYRLRTSTLPQAYPPKWHIASIAGCPVGQLWSVEAPRAHGDAAPAM